jgi:hypothetical protein
MRNFSEQKLHPKKPAVFMTFKIRSSARSRAHEIEAVLAMHFLLRSARDAIRATEENQ